MKLYLIRHAESANNAIYSSTGGERGRMPDPDITATGHQQAKLVGDHLADPRGEPQQHPLAAKQDAPHHFGLTHLYCSLMTRSILTAQYIAEACGLPLIAHPDIFEKGGIYELGAAGSMNGLPGPDRSYFNARFPNLELPPDLGDEGWYSRPFETEERFLQRIERALQDIMQRHAGTDDHVAMVVHGDFLDQFVNQMTGLARRPANYDNHWVANWAFHNTSLTRVDILADSQVIVYLNRLNHLPAELVTW